MNLFRKKFLTTLVENREPTEPLGAELAEELDGEGEGDAIVDTLDPQTDPASLDVPSNPEIALKRQQSQRTIQTITTWIGEVGNFIEYLNGTDEGSINFSLNSSDCDSLMTDIQRSESKKISRLAQDLSSLEESLKQYLLLARRKESGADSI